MFEFRIYDKGSKIKHSDFFNYKEINGIYEEYISLYCEYNKNYYSLKCCRDKKYPWKIKYNYV